VERKRAALDFDVDGLITWPTATFLAVCQKSEQNKLKNVYIFRIIWAYGGTMYGKSFEARPEFTLSSWHKFSLSLLLPYLALRLFCKTFIL